MYKESIKKVLEECGLPFGLVKPESNADKASKAQLMLEAMNEQAIAISQKKPEFHGKEEKQVAAAAIFMMWTSIQFSGNNPSRTCLNNENSKKLLSYLETV